MAIPRYFDARTRDALIDEVDGSDFDVIVVGGGINGAGVAHDAALRGLNVLLLEQRDFAFGTSSRSSKLIHGGLRYLEHYEFRLVFEGTNERAALRKVAPHLVRPLKFALPVYEGYRHPLWLMDVGLWMYDSLSLFKVEKRHMTLRSPKRLLEREPMLNPVGLTGGIIYYDCMTDDARLTLENALAAAMLGSPSVTRARVTRIDGLHDDGPARVHAVDTFSGRTFSASARVVANCTGCWTDGIRRHAGVEANIVRPTKGVHIVIPYERLPVAHAIALVVPEDGRVFFAIPWKGRTVLGTTDTDFTGDPATVGVDLADVEYLLAAGNGHFPEANLVTKDVLSAWVGLRPLVSAEAESASDVSREHQLFTDGKMVSVAGGKLTTYRRMAAEIVDEVVEVGGLKCGSSTTAKAQLPGAIGLTRDFDELASDVAKVGDLDEAAATRLATVYGVRAHRIAELAKTAPDLRARICPDRDAIFAEVIFAIREELALTIEDVLVRRTSLSLTAAGQALASVDAVADVMAAELGWSDAHRQERIDEYHASIALTRRYLDELGE